MQANNFFTPKEAAAYLGITRITLYRYFKRPPSKGGPPRQKFPGSHLWKIPKDAFIKWANNGSGA